MLPISLTTASSLLERAIVLLVVVGLTLSLQLQSAHGQPAGQNSLTASENLVDDPLYNSWRKNPSVTQCGICHYSPTNEFASRDTDFCSLSEARMWLNNDKHAISRQRVEPLTRQQLDERRKRLGDTFVSGRSGAAASAENLFGDSNVVSYSICKKLGYNIESDDGYARFRDNCLTCHAGYDKQRLQPKLTRNDSHHPGIECNYCHQVNDPPRDERGDIAWVAVHSRKTWRLLPPAEKEGSGMRNLVSARSQAELCQACHIGDISQGMFITHEMYAAGHPPLPGFELQTFTSALPPHWRNLRETAQELAEYDGMAEYFQRNISGYDPSSSPQDPMWETRKMLLGAIQAAEQSVTMLVEANNHWGDYALYDCAACHHELRLPSLRQSRPIAGIPGRPRLLEWPEPLLDVALALLAESAAEVQSARTQLRAAVNEAPFGNPEVCVPAAQRLKSALAAAADELAQQTIDADQAKSILLAMCGAEASLTSDYQNPFKVARPRDRLVDYQAARQVIWGIHTIDAELQTIGQPLSAAARQRISELGMTNGQVLLSLELPAGQSSRHYAAETARPGYLESELQRIKAYEPAPIVQQLKELAALIGES